MALLISLDLLGHLAELKCLDVDCPLETLKQLVQGDYHSQVPQLLSGVSEVFHGDFSAVTLERAAVKIWVNVGGRFAVASCARTPQH